MAAPVIEELVVTEIIEKDIKLHGEKVLPLRTPRDKYLVCHIVFFFLGILHLLPMTFFGAANNFWMYKFRNLSDPNMAAENRTFLQKNFASIQMIINTIPAVVFGCFNVLYGHKFKIMNRLIFTFIIEVLIFYTFTAFVKINTDDYQTTFFVIIMLCWGTLTAANTVNIVSSTVLYPRFPHSYMKTCLIGEGVSGLLGDGLNVIAVAIFDDVRDSTLMYFIFGSVMVTTTLILSVIISKTEFFNHYMNSLPEDHTKKAPQKKELFKVLYKIRLAIFLFLMFGVSMSATHTSITSLVVSEQDTTTSTWASKFFSPVTTFFWADFCMLLGRFLATHSPLQYLPEIGISILAVARCIILAPLIWFCNAKPRNHLTILFPHDYQYAIILGTFMTINGYLLNMGVLVIPRKTTKEESEIAYTIFGLVVGLAMTATSVIGIFIVNIL